MRIITSRVVTTLLLLLLPFFSVRARVGDSWGTNIHWTSGLAGEAEMLSKAFRVARMDLNWATVESVCGQYDFSLWKGLVSELSSVGVRPYLILDYTDPGCYGSMCNTTECWQAYGRFAAAAADALGGHGIIFESVNEANGMGHDNATSITQMSLYAGAAFHAAGEYFVGPATAGIDFYYLNQTFSMGILQAYDAVSVHPYRSGPPESAIDDYATLRALIQTYAPAGKEDMQMITGEWGYTSATLPCSYGNRVDEVTQGLYAARMWLSSAIAGVSTDILYDWKNDGTNASDCESNFGSVNGTYTNNASAPFVPKHGYLAALTLQNTVGNANTCSGRVAATVAANANTPTLPSPPLFSAALVASAQDIFVVGFPGVPASNTTTKTCPYVGTIDCGFPGVTQQQCEDKGCCFNPNQSGPWCSQKVAPPGHMGFALWTNATVCPSTAPPDSSRSDCGFDGITEQVCSQRECCWDATPGNGPQCYMGNPYDNTFTNGLPISFPVFPAGDTDCWTVTDTFGASLGNACAVAGVLTFNATNGPIYFI